MTVLVFMLWLLILKWHPQDRPLVFYWGQSYLKQIEEQTPVSRNKFEKQILPLLHVPAYAALPASVISVVMPCFYIAGTLLLGTFLFSFLDSEPVMLNTSSKYNLYRFFWSHKLSCARLNFWLGDLQKNPKSHRRWGCWDRAAHPSLSVTGEQVAQHVIGAVWHCKAVEIVLWMSLACCC